MDKYNKIVQKENIENIENTVNDREETGKMLQDIANEVIKTKEYKKAFEAIKSYRPPGIMAYIKETHEKEFLEYLVQEEHVGMNREIDKYSSLPDYMRRISCCDYSGEPFEEQDNVIRYWVTSKESANEFRKRKESKKNIK